MHEDMTYQEWEARQAQWMEGQDNLFYKGHKVTPTFDMVMRNDAGHLQRVRPKLQHASCYPTRVKRYGQVHCGVRVYTPKMYVSAVC